MSFLRNWCLKVTYQIIMLLCDCGDIYVFNRFCFKNKSHKNPIWDLILIYITEFSIKSCACAQIFRPSQKIFSRISSYLLWSAIACNIFFSKFTSDPLAYILSLRL